MSDSSGAVSVSPRFVNAVVLGLLAGAGASYGLYKLISVGVKRRRLDKDSTDPSLQTAVQRGSLLTRLSALDVVCAPRPRVSRKPEEKTERTPAPVGNLEGAQLEALLWTLKSSCDLEEKKRILISLGNAAAFTNNQELIRELSGIPVVADFLSDSAPELRVLSLNVLNNLCMNLSNQEELKVYVPKVLELIETSAVNSDLQLSALRVLTNLTTIDQNQLLLKEPSTIKLLLSLLVVSNEQLQVQALKVLVNLSSNPHMMDDIVQVQAPASLLLLFDPRTPTEVLLRLLTFAGNLKTWRASAQAAEELRGKPDSLFRLMLDDSCGLHNRVLPLLSHPEPAVRQQAVRVFS